MAKERRAPIKTAIKHRLMAECDSACADCRDGTPSKIDFHHIDGNRSNSTYENLLVVCAGCHAEFTRGTKSEADAMLLKRMAQASKLPPRRGSEARISVGVNSGVVAGNVGTLNFRVSGRESKAPALIPGTIGADPDMRTYANYLVGRYIDWRKKSDEQLRRLGRPPRRAFSPGSAHGILGEGFGVTNSVLQISEDRFFPWVASAQAKIDRTVWGKKNPHRNYHTWEEHLRERRG